MDHHDGHAQDLGTDIHNPEPDPESLPTLGIVEFMALLNSLASASHHNDAERYRATLTIARREGASVEQIKDAWLYGWTGRFKALPPDFDAWGNSR